MKTAISIPDATFGRVEEAAAWLGVSRSEFFTRAAERWLDDLEGAKINSIDAALADAQDTAFAERAASDLAQRADWVIQRGEIWWADLGLPRGSAPALRRPVLVISDDRYNRSRLQTVTVVVLTSNTRLAALPGNVAVSAESSGLDRDSVVNVTQVATIDRDALEEIVAPLPSWLMARVGEGLRAALAL